MARPRKTGGESNQGAKPTCPECGGKKFGRGFNHAPGCSLSRPSGSARPGGAGRRTGKRGRPKGSRNVATMARMQAAGEPAGGSKIDMRIVRGMSAHDLIKLRERIDELLKSKMGEVKQQISVLQRVMNMIRG